MHLSTPLAALLATTVNAQRIDKPASFPNLDWMGPKIQSLPKTSILISPWVSGNIAKGCRDRLALANKDPTTFKQYTIFYGDCGMPWWVCRENGASVSIEEHADAFARVPVGMRQYVGDVVIFKDGGSATTWGSQIVAFEGATAKHVGVMIHEASHCVDGENGMGMKSGDQTWRDAVDKDSHVIDNYAQTNHVENFAQYAGAIIYDRVTNGDFANVQQYAWTKEQVYRMAVAADSKQPWGDHMLALADSGKRCGWRWPHSGHVNPVTGERVPSDDDKYSVRPATSRVAVGTASVSDGKEGWTLTNCNITDS